MKLKSATRLNLFNRARKLSGELGDLFQNEIELSEEDIQKEIDHVRRLRAAAIKQHEDYIWELGDLLCFPEKFK